jgi:hypothetical protein
VALPDPPGFLCLQELVRAFRAMSTGAGYYLDYSDVRPGIPDWSAERCPDEPVVNYFPEETEQTRGGERAGGSAFRTEDVIHVVVHLKSSTDEMDLLDKMYRVRNDLRKAALVDRSLGLGTTTAHPNVYVESTRFLFPEVVPEGLLGGTVEARVTIRWDDYPQG